MMGGMATDTRIGTTIRDARERKQWTQQQLAKLAGVAVRTVNDWENDRSYPRNRVGALEELLGIRLPRAGRGPEDGAAVIPARLRRVIMEELPDPEDQRRVIGLLERTLRRRAAGLAEDEAADGEQLPG